MAGQGELEESQLIWGAAMREKKGIKREDGVSLLGEKEYTSSVRDGKPSKRRKEAEKSVTARLHLYRLHMD